MGAASQAGKSVALVQGVYVGSSLNQGPLFGPPYSALFPGPLNGP